MVRAAPGGQGRAARPRGRQAAPRKASLQRRCEQQHLSLHATFRSGVSRVVRIATRRVVFPSFWGAVWLASPAQLLVLIPPNKMEQEHPCLAWNLRWAAGMSYTDQPGVCGERPTSGGPLPEPPPVLDSLLLVHSSRENFS